MINASGVSANCAYTHFVDLGNLISELVATYKRHGWTLREVLLRPESKDAAAEWGSIDDAEIREADFDALWFSRPSHEKREAWELRLISEQAYALFEAFEADESEEERADARREMENRMREQVTRA
jgi:Asp-tRNA(Asn)/Glu-tRNA(Gln) amidotransferase A subunit family amidase